jgi:MscS family membrane protein
MSGILHPADGSFWAEEMFLINNATITLLLGVFAAALLTRFLTMLLAPRLMSKIIHSEKVRSVAVRNSDKALGSAAGAGLALYLVNTMIDMMDEPNSGIDLPGFAVELIPNALQFIFAVSIVLWAFRLVPLVQDVVELLDNDDELDGTEKTLISAVESMLRFAIAALGSVFVADALGFDLTSLIAGLGISGLALALAAKDTISNLFGATTVLLDRPFKIGDWVIIDSVEGEVVEISLRTTLIRTAADTIVTVPNANLVNTPVENFGKRRWRRWQTALHLDLNSDPAKVAEFCTQVLESITESPVTVKPESSWCQVSTLTATSLDVSVNLYWDVAGGAPERKAKEELVLGIMQLAKDNGLSFFDPRMVQAS